MKTRMNISKMKRLTVFALTMLLVSLAGMNLKANDNDLDAFMKKTEDGIRYTAPDANELQTIENLDNYFAEVGNNLAYQAPTYHNVEIETLDRFTEEIMATLKYKAPEGSVEIAMDLIAQLNN